MKRALASIDSKLNQAKGWLRDPGASPGNPLTLSLSVPSCQLKSLVLQMEANPPLAGLTNGQITDP